MAGGFFSDSDGGSSVVETGMKSEVSGNTTTEQTPGGLFQEASAVEADRSAHTAAGEAEEYADLARDWAIGPDGTPGTPSDSNNSKYYSEQAEDEATDAATSATAAAASATSADSDAIVAKGWATDTDTSGTEDYSGNSAKYWAQQAQEVETTHIAEGFGIDTDRSDNVVTVAVDTEKIADTEWVKDYVSNNSTSTAIDSDSDNNNINIRTVNDTELISVDTDVMATKEYVDREFADEATYTTEVSWDYETGTLTPGTFKIEVDSNNDARSLIRYDSDSVSSGAFKHEFLKIYATSNTSVYNIYKVLYHNTFFNIIQIQTTPIVSKGTLTFSDGTNYTLQVDTESVAISLGFGLEDVEGDISVDTDKVADTEWVKTYVSHEFIVEETYNNLQPNDSDYAIDTAGTPFNNDITDTELYIQYQGGGSPARPSHIWFSLTGVDTEVLDSANYLKVTSGTDVAYYPINGHGHSTNFGGYAVMDIGVYISDISDSNVLGNSNTDNNGDILTLEVSSGTGTPQRIVAGYGLRDTDNTFRVDTDVIADTEFVKDYVSEHGGADGNYYDTDITSTQTSITSDEDFLDTEALITYINGVQIDKSEYTISNDNTITFTQNLLNGDNVTVVSGATRGGEGPAGAAGTAATISVGTVTTLDSDSDATVTNSGSNSAAVFDFGIPKGDKGDKGDTGAAGTDGFEYAVEAESNGDPVIGDFTGNVTVIFQY